MFVHRYSHVVIETLFLGFLSTGDKVLSGNYGLKDFAAVLNWVQENIAAFGGDKHRVTVFGFSSGGVTSALAIVSPLTKGKLMRQHMKVIQIFDYLQK